MSKEFDFKAARQRIEELKLMYRRLSHTQDKDGTWDWLIMAQIEELEYEIEMALKESISNVVRPMVAAWAR